MIIILSCSFNGQIAILKGLMQTGIILPLVVLYNKNSVSNLTYLTIRKHVYFRIMPKIPNFVGNHIMQYCFMTVWSCFYTDNIQTIDWRQYILQFNGMRTPPIRNKHLSPMSGLHHSHLW